MTQTIRRRSLLTRQCCELLVNKQDINNNNISISLNVVLFFQLSLAKRETTQTAQAKTTNVCSTNAQVIVKNLEYFVVKPFDSNPYIFFHFRKDI